MVDVRQQRVSSRSAGTEGDEVETSVGRSSPPTERVTKVIDFLVARPGQRFGLSELARRLDMSKPTCLGIVTALGRAGYLTRDPRDKTYALGPAFIAAGRAAQENFTAVQAARPYMSALSRDLGMPGTVSAVVGDHITILERTGPPDRLYPTGRIGQPYPFAPPLGLMFVIWAPDRALRQWLAKKPTLPMTLDEDYLHEVVAACRQRGYLIECLTPVGAQLHSLMAGVATYDLPDQVLDLVSEMATTLGERVYLTGDLAPEERLAVSMVAAPTYDVDGEQELLLTVYIRDEVTGAEIERTAAALVNAAEAVTAAVGGHDPWKGEEARPPTGSYSPNM